MSLSLSILFEVRTSFLEKNAITAAARDIGLAIVQSMFERGTDGRSHETLELI